MFVDISEIKSYINKIGIKQKVIAEKIGMTDTQFSAVINGNRKLEAGEYASLCNVLNVPFDKFVRNKEVME